MPPDEATSRTFGQIVREARLERHLSMGQLAAAVDRSTASVRRWERNDGLPTPEVIELLIERLALDPDEMNSVLAAAGLEADGGDAGEPVAIEESDPIDVVALSEVADAVGAGSMEDWEQPSVTVASQAAGAPGREGSSVVVAAPPPSAWPTASVPVAVIEQDQNLLQILRDPDQPWLGYIRAALTVVVLAGLVWVLLWALPEFLDAFGEMWDSLWETEGTTT